MKSQNNSAFSGAIGFALLAMSVGCDDATSGSKPTTKPVAAIVTGESTQPSAVLAAYPIRPPSMMTVDGHDVTFPAAKLAVIDHHTGGITLRLCSDDPPAAIDPGYVGNSFVLDMRLAIDRLDDIPAATWDYKSSDADESASGIFLHGYKEQFHPAEVHISFQKNGDELLTLVTGTFLHSDAQNPAAAAERVQVTGCLRTSLPTN